MKLAYKHRFCIWLVDTLIRCPMTFEEIRRSWIVSSANVDAAAITERTFSRYKQDAEIMMDVTIVCDKSDGYRYKISESELERKSLATEWMLGAFRISNLTASIKKKGTVVLESAPPAAHLLTPIAEAIDNRFYLKFTYKSHYHGSFSEVELIPAFVRLYKHRWYVIGKLKKEESSKTYAFERIGSIEVIQEKIALSKSWEKQLSPSEYYMHCFGIIRQHEPIKIGFRAFFPQDAYIRDVPIHASQQEIYACEEYADFEIFLRPTYDLKQELLWHRDKLAVLTPKWFLQDMIKILNSTIKNYNTGQNHALDE